MAARDPRREAVRHRPTGRDDHQRERQTIDAWHSGKHRDFGANVQAVMRPDGLPIWTSDAMPGHLHDLTCAQHLNITGALYWAASELRLPTLADSG